jgi:hypothetical protein
MNQHQSADSASAAAVHKMLAESGYSDKAMIHVQDNEEQLSFLIEPFLTKVTLYDKYASFED